MTGRRMTMKGGAASVAAKAAAVVIEDYKLEELLRRPFRNNEPGADYPGLCTDITWRQIVQYSASHIVNDYFSLTPEQRSAEAIDKSAHRRWSNRAYKFESADHYHYIRNVTVSNVTRFLSEDRDIVPLVLFESFRRHIPSVNSDISFITQVLYRTGSGKESPYVIQKYLVDDDPGVIAGFRHIAVLFGSEAFGSLPGRIEVFGVLSGNRYVFRPQPEEIAKAADYIRLLRDYMPRAETGARAGRSHTSICGKCALRNKGVRSPEHAGPAPLRRVVH
ncbi:hypothetical protein FE783_30290 [Paenibacillus mesophilus]|uniref:hypothetical protein n=1 Tax=Paenibacillus mesophilus TaxID=2582849 RepID=UPI00110DA7F0|nr:hypothetical protein [Paenibacillus mesophilus]TMV45149.1 hypothetical protein FE783_30290 [Paenibacillus mesophilus]